MSRKTSKLRWKARNRVPKTSNKLAAYLEDAARCIMLDTPCDHANALKIAAHYYQFDMKCLRTDNAPVQVKTSKFRSASEKAHKTMGLLVGRSTLKQQEYLEVLGVPRATSVQWTMHRASKEIGQRVERKRSDSARRGAPSATLSTPERDASRGKTPGSSSSATGMPGVPERQLREGELRGGWADSRPQVNTTTEKAAVPVCRDLRAM